MPRRKLQPLTDRDRDVLTEMERVPMGRHYHYMIENYVKLIDLGASANSEHHAIIRKLMRHGLVERARYGGGPVRPAWMYRLTERGREAVRRINEGHLE
jgi:DNA-binding MarR family transcriptional regulator